MPFAVDEKVLVGNNEHQAYVARPVRAGDDSVLVRWESTKKEEEVAVGDVKKIDLEAKRQTRGKRREASGAEVATPAPREPPRKRRKKKALPSAHESLHEEIERHLKALRSGDAKGKEASADALEKLANEDDAKCAPIAQRLVGLLSGGSAGCKEAAARALSGIAYKNAANRAAITEAGGIPPLVALTMNGDADGQRKAARVLMSLAYDNASCTAIAQRIVGLLSGGTAGGRAQAARVLTRLAVDNVFIKDAIVKAGGIAPLVALVTNGTAGGQEEAAAALGHLAAWRRLGQGEAANEAAIVAAGGVEALVALAMNGSDRCKEKAKWALSKLPLAERFSQLRSENASLKRQLAGEEDVVSLCDGEAPLPAKESSALRDAHDKQQTAILRRVKEEKADAEGARDRNDAVAAAASTAAATAAADAREAAREAAQELVDVHDDFVNPLTLTVNALQTKIDELHALASQVDPVAADAIKNRPN